MISFYPELIIKIREAKIIATVTIDQPENAVPLAGTLLRSGIKAIELTLRTEFALHFIEAIRKNFPDMIVGAGTVIFREQVRNVMNAGVHFAVSPGTNRNVIEEAIKFGLPFAPGIATPSDIESCLAHSIVNDFNYSTRSEIEILMKGNASGRVVR